MHWNLPFFPIRQGLCLAISKYTFFCSTFFFPDAKTHFIASFPPSTMTSTIPYLLITTNVLQKTMYCKINHPHLSFIHSSLRHNFYKFTWADAKFSAKNSFYEWKYRSYMWRKKNSTDWKINTFFVIKKYLVPLWTKIEITLLEMILR